MDAPGRRRLPHLLRRAWYGLNQSFRRRLAHLELTPDQYTVLRILKESGAVTQRQLTQHMSSDPNTVASLLERMERAGLVDRRPHAKDRRAHHVEICPAGLRKFEQGRELAVGLQQEVLSAVPAAELEGFLATLEAVADACRKAVDASGE